MKTLSFVVLALVLVGCGTAASVPSGSGANRTAKLISQAEIAHLDQAATAYDIVAQSRPMWLMSRRYAGESTKALVYLDGQRIGPIEILYDLDARAVASMQFVNAADASLQYGPVHPDGAIYITSQAHQQMLDAQEGRSEGGQ